MRSMIIGLIFKNPVLYGNVLGLSLSLFIISIFHPYLKFEGIKKTRFLVGLLSGDPLKIVITNTGSMILFHHDCVLKIPLCTYSKQTLHQDCINFSKLQSTQCRRLFDYRFEEVLDGDYALYSMNILNPSDNIGAEKVKDLIVFFQEGHKEGFNFLMSLEEQVKGFQLLKEHMKAEEKILAEDVVLRLSKVKCRSARMHGDLTPSNIMQGAHGLILIDLDRYNENGMSFIDIIHYRVEYASQFFNERTYLIMSRVFKGIIDEGENTTEELLSYLLFRVGAEYREGYLRDSKYYIKAKDIFMQFASLDKDVD